MARVFWGELWLGFPPPNPPPPPRPPPPPMAPGARPTARKAKCPAIAGHLAHSPGRWDHGLACVVPTPHPSLFTRTHSTDPSANRYSCHVDVSGSSSSRDDWPVRLAPIASATQLASW